MGESECSVSSSSPHCCRGSSIGYRQVNAAALQYPVIGFTRNVYHRIPGEERIEFFSNENLSSICSAADLKLGARKGMLLADSAGRCWKIVEVHDLGVVGSCWGRFFRFLFRQSIHRVSYELEEVAALSLDDVKERVRDIIDADPERWKDDEAVGGESAPPRDEREMLDELKERVRMAPSIAEIIYALEPSERLGGEPQ